MAGRQTAVIDQAVAIGPGPTPTTMVLAKVTDAGSGGILMHDAGSGTEYPLGNSTMKLVHARGRKVLYAKASPEGNEVLRIAEIVVKPDKSKIKKDGEKRIGE